MNKGKGFNRYRVGAFCQSFIENPQMQITEICKRLKISRDRPYEWQNAGELDKAFDAIGYTGTRNLRRHVRRDASRDSSEQIEMAKAIYLESRKIQKKKGASDALAAEAVGVSQSTVYNWRKRFGWDN